MASMKERIWSGAVSGIILHGRGAGVQCLLGFDLAIPLFV